MTSQEEALTFLDSLIDYEKVTTYAYDAMKLERMRILLEALGNPQDSFKSIHVAGSRGKGSCCAMLYRILQEAGFSVGLYTSPHLVSREERIRWAAQAASDRQIQQEEAARLVDRIRPVVERLSREREERFTFFEVFTAIAFLFFREKGVAIAILEVGMGGRLDATNVVHPLVAAITRISYDHTDKLGKTLTEIAREKAHIFKKGSLAVVSYQEEESLAEIRRVAKGVPVELLEVSSTYAYRLITQTEAGSRFDVKGPAGDDGNLFLSLLGEHQVRNAVAAIAVCDALSQKGMDIPRKAIREGFSSVSWPGRFHIVAKEPTVIVDGAQDASSAQAVRETVSALFKDRPLHLILGISANKEIDAVCKILCPLAKQVIVTQAGNVRALDVACLRQQALPYAAHLEAAPSLGEALRRARREAGPQDIILVAGSLYLVGEALALVGDRQETEKQRNREAEKQRNREAERQEMVR